MLNNFEKSSNLVKMVKLPCFLLKKEHQKIGTRVLRFKKPNPTISLKARDSKPVLLVFVPVLPLLLIIPLYHKCTFTLKPTFFCFFSLQGDLKEKQREKELAEEENFGNSTFGQIRTWLWNVMEYPWTSKIAQVRL